MEKEKKEIGMEKLIELLNEREKELSPSVQVEWTELSVGISKWYLISKECGFIKWLVENDKIEWEKVYENLKDYEVEIRIRAVKKLQLSSEKKSLWYLELLMLLSIQDNPIEFLLSIIK